MLVPSVNGAFAEVKRQNVLKNEKEQSHILKIISYIVSFRQHNAEFYDKFPYNTLDDFIVCLKLTVTIYPGEELYK
jgi:hypothetical protein